MAKKKQNTSILRFDNHVSLGHITTTVCIIVAGILWYANTENRLKQLEVRYVEIAASIEKQNRDFNEKIRDQKTEIKDDIRDIKDYLKSISQKLDNKADKR